MQIPRFCLRNSSYFILAGNLPSEHGTLSQSNGQYCTSLTTNRGVQAGNRLGERKMLWTITIILFILWVVGLVSSYTLGGWIHILLVLAIIVLIFNLMSGRRAI
jgi:Family of unknown function (DUF5670)